jgi:tetraacyldisaccharide 4'-kinase
MIGWLRPLSWLYGRVLSRRRARLRQLPPWHLPVPVISVGNITTGGTGKTEAVAYICRHLLSRGIKPGILSRGYRRRGKEISLVVSQGDGPEVAVDRAGDEPFLLAQRLKGAAVVVGSDRWITGMLAVKTLDCQALVLDDGFQRRDRLYRDLDVVLVDAADPFGGGELLPAGKLREPVSALAEAGIIIVTRADQHPTAALRAQLAELAPEAMILEARHTPASLVSLDGRRRQSPEFLGRRRVLAVAGIARPQAFARTLAGLGAVVTGHFDFPDHHWFSARDRQNILARALALKSEIVTTAKDAVRLAWPAEAPVQGWSLGVAFDFLSQASKFNARLDKVLAGKKKSR